jgi:hypothetical protein
MERHHSKLTPCLTIKLCLIFFWGSRARRDADAAYQEIATRCSFCHSIPPTQTRSPSIYAPFTYLINLAEQYVKEHDMQVTQQLKYNGGAPRGSDAHANQRA